MAKNNKNEVILMCEERYLAGESMATIMANFCVKQKTLYNWAYKYDWLKKREALHEKIQNAICKKITDQAISSVQRHVTGTTIASQIAIEALNAIYEEIKADATGKASEKYVKYSAQVEKWTAILAKSSTVLNNSVPSADETISQKILADLQELKQLTRRETGQ